MGDFFFCKSMFKYIKGIRASSDQSESESEREKIKEPAEKNGVV